MAELKGDDKIQIPFSKPPKYETRDEAIARYKAIIDAPIGTVLYGDAPITEDTKQFAKVFYEELTLGYSDTYVQQVKDAIKDLPPDNAYKIQAEADLKKQAEKKAEQGGGSDTTKYIIIGIVIFIVLLGIWYFFIRKK